MDGILLVRLYLGGAAIGVTAYLLGIAYLRGHRFPTIALSAMGALSGCVAGAIITVGEFPPPVVAIAILSLAAGGAVTTPMYPRWAEALRRSRSQ